MKKILPSLIVALILLASCGKDQDPFLIDQTRVGLITQQTQIRELDSLFAGDSIVRAVNPGQFSGNRNEIQIFDSQGNRLLLVEPVQAFDSTSTIGFIQVMDARYTTSKGLGPESTFKDIVENYSISRIENTLRAAVVFIDELNLYITIDKQELPSELRYDTQSRILASQIPDNARFKYFMINWD